MKNKGIYLIVGVVLGIVLGILVGKGYEQKITDIVYSTENIELGVSIPVSWTYNITKPRAATETIEGTTDSGIEIYINGDENSKIYLFSQESTISFPGSEEEEFITTDNLKGSLIKNDSDSQVNHIVIFEAFKAAVVYNLDTDTYKKNESKMNQVLKSITIK